MLRVCSEQPMQHAGAAPRQTYDKERFANLLALNIRVELPIPFHLQTHAQCVQNIGFQGDFSDQVQLRLVLA